MQCHKLLFVLVAAVGLVAFSNQLISAPHSEIR